jgi:hypothetical protein
MPMPFWDRFVLALYFGLAQHLPVGRDAALRILDEAIARERLSLSGLNDTSLLLLLALLPELSPHRPTVVNLGASRGLHVNPVHLIQLLQAAPPPRLIEIVELGRVPGPHVGTVAFLQAILAPNRLGVVENLCLYLGRLYLLDPNRGPVRSLTLNLIGEATQQYLQHPLGEVDYLSFVYGYARVQALSLEVPLPTVFPPGPRPGWFQGLAQEEQQFIDACLRDLSEPCLDLLYLNFYARLTVEQIADALHSESQQSDADAVASRLEECWSTIL